MTWYPLGNVVVWALLVLVQVLSFWQAGRDGKALPPLARQGVQALVRTGAVLISVIATVQLGFAVLGHDSWIGPVGSSVCLVLIVVVLVCRQRATKKVRRLNRC